MSRVRKRNYWIRFVETLKHNIFVLNGFQGYDVMEFTWNVSVILFRCCIFREYFLHLRSRHLNVTAHNPKLGIHVFLSGALYGSSLHKLRSWLVTTFLFLLTEYWHCKPYIKFSIVTVVTSTHTKRFSSQYMLLLNKPPTQTNQKGY